MNAGELGNWHLLWAVPLALLYTFFYLWWALWQPRRVLSQPVKTREKAGLVAFGVMTVGMLLIIFGIIPDEGPWLTITLVVMGVSFLVSIYALRLLSGRRWNL